MLDFFQRSKDCCHAAVIVYGNAGHLAATRADGFESIRKRKGIRRNQRAIFTEAVAHGEVWFNAIGSQHPRQREIGSQHGRLSDGGLAKIFFRLGNRVGIAVIHKNELA